jgi:hypothetical protein
MNVTDFSFVVYSVLLFIMEALSLLALAVNSQLLAFHGYLKVRNITTYEYILRKGRKVNPYQVSNSIRVISKEAIEAVPLEEVYEPYMLNPQYKLDETQSDINTNNLKRVVPIRFRIEK